MGDRVEYVVASGDHEEFMKEVNLYFVKWGYRPQGGISISVFVNSAGEVCYRYAQAFISASVYTQPING